MSERKRTEPAPDYILAPTVAHLVAYAVALEAAQQALTKALLELTDGADTLPHDHPGVVEVKRLRATMCGRDLSHIKTLRLLIDPIEAA